LRSREELNRGEEEGRQVDVLSSRLYQSKAIIIAGTIARGRI
jgi:hypothetical protein